MSYIKYKGRTIVTGWKATLIVIATMYVVFGLPVLAIGLVAWSQ